MTGYQVMRMHRPLDDILTSGGQLSVLRTLVSFPTNEFTGRELARLSGRSLAQVQVALGKLHRAGLVEVRSVGRAHQWRFASENIFSAPLTQLFSAERDILANLSSELRAALPKADVAHAVIYGSVARASERPDSDLDLFVEARDARAEARVKERLGPIVQRFNGRYGVHVSPLIVSRRSKQGLNPNVLRDVETDGIPVLP